MKSLERQQNAKRNRGRGTEEVVQGEEWKKKKLHLKLLTRALLTMVTGRREMKEQEEEVERTNEGSRGFLGEKWWSVFIYFLA